MTWPRFGATTFHPNGCVEVNLGDASYNSPEGARAMLNCAAVVKAAKGDSPMFINPTLSEEDRLVIAKASQLANVNIVNAPEKTLDEVNPALAKKMEAAWAEMIQAIKQVIIKTVRMTRDKLLPVLR